MIMKRPVLLLLLLMVGSVLAVPPTDISFFYSVGCSHCEKVVESGILENVSGIDGVEVKRYEVSSPVNRERYLGYVDKFGISGAGIPFVVIERDGEFNYLMGDSPVIEDLEHDVLNFRAFDAGNVDVVSRDLGLWVVLGAAVIDSVNPCAFGVLLFLMAVLLSMGSSRRAFRSGLIYTFSIFVVYLAAGFGIMRFAGDFLALENVKFFVGVIIFLGALIEFKDFFWEGKGFSLSIPKGTKPYLERFARKGTLFSLVVLGALVALVELPCTGGIYLAILSMIAGKGFLGIVYLILYNLVFVLPLVFISYAVYRGARVESVNSWVQKNKRFMRLAAGIVMLGLAASLLGWI
jgi:cytochrome c biogenesis protein CcdA